MMDTTEDTENQNEGDGTFFMYRLPALSVEELRELVASYDGTAVEEIVAKTIERAKSPDVLQLLQSASIELSEEIRSQNNTSGSPSKAQLRLARALVGYLARLSTRGTPFGLLTSMGVGAVAERSELVLPPVESDVAVCDLAPYLGMVLSSALRDMGSLSPDPTAYSVRQTTRRYLRETTAWQLAEEPISSPSDTSIRAPLASTEPDSVRALLGELADGDLGALSDAAAQVLSSIPPEMPALNVEWGSQYQRCQKNIDTLLEILAPELAREPRRSSRVVLTSRVCRTRLTIGFGLLAEVRQAAEALYRLTEGETSDTLEQFRRRFIDKFGDSFVPLLEAIDPGAGVGYLPDDGVSLELLDQPLVGQQTHEHSGSASLSEVLLQARADPSTPIQLADGWVGAELDHDQFTVLGNLAREDGFILELVTVGDLRLFGRFGPELPELSDAMRRRGSALASGRPDVVHAEVAFIPRGAASNVVRRSQILPHEIVCYGRASKGATSIPANELLVGVEGGRVRLWWVRTKQWVKPYLNCAHYANPVRFPVYRFLADLARRDTTTRSWSWGPLRRARQVPAVYFGRVQLSPRTWFIDQTMFRTLMDAEGSKRMTELRQFREEHDVPRRVQAGFSDLFIEADLENPLFVESILHKARDVGGFELRESKVDTTDVVTRGGKSYCNEVVISFPPQISKFQAPQVRSSPERRLRFPPDPQWVTLKVYGERDHLEQLLTGTLAPWAEEGMSSGEYQNWHYLRYADPQPHLRFRIQGPASSLERVVAESYKKKLRGLGFTVESYRPELERYGGRFGMDICESVFTNDSRMAVQVVSALPGDTAVKRWELSLALVDSMFETAGLKLSERVALCERMRDGYMEMFRLDRPRSLKVLSGSYRQRRTRVERVLLVAQSQASGVATHYPGIARLAQARTRLAIPLEDVLASLIHMHLNRTLGVSQAQQEVAIYDYLRRQYRSALARAGQD